MRTRLLLAIAMAIALAAAAPGTARADWDDRPDPAEFEETLAPHGYWVDDAGYGRAWRPYMHWGWQPYVDGRWLWTSYGWTWSSYEPWSWTFHYGRWGFSNLYGWVWTPGYVWGPAWVDWYWGDGYVGWAPLAPIGFGPVPGYWGYWNYVRDSHFCSPHVNNVIVGHDHLPNYIVHHRDNGWGRSHPPHLRDIEPVSRHEIVRSDRPADSVAPWVRHRLERGERVRERVADRDGERVIEHRGKAPRDERPGVAGRDRSMEHRGSDARPGDRDRGTSPRFRGRDDDGRPGVVDDGGWRRPTPAPHVTGRDVPESARPGHRLGSDRPDPRVIDPRARQDDPRIIQAPRRSGPEPRTWSRPPARAPEQRRTYEPPRAGGRPMQHGAPAPVQTAPAPYTAPVPQTAPAPQMGRGPSTGSPVIQHGAPSVPQQGPSTWRGSGGGVHMAPGAGGSGERRGAGSRAH